MDLRFHASAYFKPFRSAHFIRELFFAETFGAPKFFIQNHHFQFVLNVAKLRFFMGVYPG